MIDKKLQIEIEKILDSYGFKYSHNSSGFDNIYYDKHWNKETGGANYFIIFDIKEKEFSIFNCKQGEGANVPTPSYLDGEHLTLNAVCSILSNL